MVAEKVSVPNAFIIGNGESRKIFNLDLIKGKGIIYGCNAIYRDHPHISDKIVAVNDDMFSELQQAKDKMLIPGHVQIYNRHTIPQWNYVLPNDPRSDENRFWAGSPKKDDKQAKRLDFSKAKGSGCSALLLACEQGHDNIFIVAFDMVGAQQWMIRDGGISTQQNNLYKDTKNYPPRSSMKAYLKFEWRYQLKQIARKYTNKNFFYINRTEILESNYWLHSATENLKNFRYGSYADLKRVADGVAIKSIRWKKY